MKTKAIIVDLDGTLCNIEHRRPLVTGDKKEWDAFADACIYDTIYPWCSELVNAMKAAHVRITFVTGRMESHRKQTENWLKEQLNFLPNVDYKLFMRPTGDYRPDDVLKKELYDTCVEPFFEVVFVVDDRNKVVKMWRSIGLTVLHCADGDF